MGQPSAAADGRARVAPSAGAPPAWEATTDEVVLPSANASAASQSAWLRRRWWAVGAWFRNNSFQPAWLPVRWRHPATGYVAAGLVEGLAILLTLLLVTTLPGFPFPGMLGLLGVMAVALTFGAGPSLLAIVAGGGLLWFAVLPPPFSWTLGHLGDDISLTLWVAVGLAMSVMASRAEHARRAAQAATRQRDAFLSMASHELRTPLTALQGHTQRLARYLDRAEAGARDADDVITTARPMVLGIEKGSRRMARLVDELLDVSRIQASKLVLHRREVDLGEVVRDAVEERRQQQPDRNIHLELAAEPVPVVADADRIGEVVTNYLTNALKYSPEDQPVVVTLRVEQSAARVSIRDAGPGLPPEEHERVWEQFHRSPGVEVLNGSSIGLGLGLHICRTFVELHPGGRVGLESAVGKGSTFWFTLPLACAEAGGNAAIAHH